MKNWINKKSIKFWIQTGLSVFLFVTIGVYSFVQMREIFYGVNIKANIEGYAESTHISKISGQAKNAIYFAINGREVFIDKEGAFTENLALPSGFSIVTLTAKDKFGKTIEKTMEIYTAKEKAVAYQVKEKHL
jgi:hypothetical protein